MKKVIVAAALAVFASTSGIAIAADLGSLKDMPEYTPPAALWTGWYMGGHIGGAWGNVEVGDTYDYNGDPFKKSSFGTSGLIGGVQIGYNRQRGNIVYGIEADLGYMGLNGEKTVYLPPEHPDKYNDLNGTYSSNGGLYGDLTARLGYAKGNTLFYLKGGAAFLNADFDAHYAGNNWCTFNTSSKCNSNQSTFNFSESDTLWGWTIGAGVEYSLTSSISLKAEYQHFDFGSTSLSHNGSYTFNDCGWTSELKGNVEMSPTVDAVKLGINYRFNGGDGLK